jgi:hypothetical protein
MFEVFDCLLVLLKWNTSDLSSLDHYYSYIVWRLITFVKLFKNDQDSRSNPLFTAIGSVVSPRQRHRISTESSGRGLCKPS